MEATNNQRINFWRCYGAGHTIGGCPTKPRNKEERIRTYEARKEQPRNVCPIRDKQVKTCIVVKFCHHHISALLDTGSDISIAKNEVAKKYNWHPSASYQDCEGKEWRKNDYLWNSTNSSLCWKTKCGLRNSHFAWSQWFGSWNRLIGKTRTVPWDFREQRIKFWRRRMARTSESGRIQKGTKSIMRAKTLFSHHFSRQ